jgi:uncharacterized membrane protein
MSANSVFVQALADACDRPVEVSPELEATTLGAGFLAGLAVGTWGSEDDVADAWSPKALVEPSGKPNSDRDRWRHAVSGRASGIPNSAPSNSEGRQLLALGQHRLVQVPATFDALEHLSWIETQPIGVAVGQGVVQFVPRDRS